mmetsp:Transcript_119651/g.381845  ORF Transcript_119651/g.381845 Transcript_119651/m.381845 type:complete len:260 (-) Transcript_119651:136-915(-)
MEGRETCDAVPPRILGLWLLHHRHLPARQGYPEVHGKAGRDAEEPGHATSPQGRAVLHVVLREVLEVLEQECVHPDRLAGQGLLHLREERILLDLPEPCPLRHHDGAGIHHPLHRQHGDRRRHNSLRLLHLADATPGRLPGHAGLGLLSHGLRGCEALHERLWPRRRHLVAVLHRCRGAEAGQRLRAEAAAEPPERQRQQEGQAGSRVSASGEQRLQAFYMRGPRHRSCARQPGRSVRCRHSRHDVFPLLSAHLAPHHP